MAGMLDQHLTMLVRHHVSTMSGKLRVTFAESCHIAGDIDVLVRGILISSTPARRQFRVGEFIDLPVNYFPNVQLPVDIRVCSGDEEIVAPVTMKSSEDVMSIMGQGEITAENLSLEAGLLRGTLVLGGNAVSTPHAFVRLNGLVIRSVVVEPPVARDTRGAVCRFAVPVRPSDFVESGLSIDLHVNGIDYPLADFTYSRGDPSEHHLQLIKLQEELRQAHKAQSTQLEMLNTSFERRLALQQERIDAFIEYAVSILLDNLTSSFEKKSDPAAFLLALNEARQRTVGTSVAETKSQAISSAELEMDSIQFAFGWYGLERNEHGLFRWMGQTALVNNPYPSLPILKVQLLISQVYGAAEPLLRASADDVELQAETAKLGSSFLVSFIAPPGPRGMCAQSVRVESFCTGCPATDEGTTDTRTLSVSALKVSFHYDQSRPGSETRA